MKIAFITLFLGLAQGPHLVDLAVEGPVASVELLLDGAVAGRIAAPPWQREIDFGSALVPHELVARALDAEGREMASTRQWINLPRPAAEVEILLEGAERPSGVRLTWQSRTGEQPVSVLLALDGEPLAVGPDGRASLPAYDPESAHVLSAEIRFPMDMVARRDAVFGGKYGSEVSTDLTAVPVRVHRRKPTVASLQGQLLADGKPLVVMAVEEDPAEVFMVRDQGIADALRKEALTDGSRKQRLEMGLGEGRRLRVEPNYLRYESGLRKQDEIRFIRPVPRSFVGSGMRSDLFDSSRAYTIEDGGVHWFLTRLSTPGGDSQKPQRLADAVAVAGIQAMSGSRPRAVVLVLDAVSEDDSIYDAAAVRRYLASIRVPLFVWTVVEGAAASPDFAAWGEVDEVWNLNRLSKAVARLRDEVESQRIVWVAGTHLPQSITLAPGAEGIELP